MRQSKHYLENFNEIEVKSNNRKHLDAAQFDMQNVVKAYRFPESRFRAFESERLFMIMFSR